MKFHCWLILFAAGLAGCVSKNGLRSPLQDTPPARSDSFRETMENALGAPFRGGNRVTTLINGDQIFPTMLRAIRQAERSVTFETFVFEAGDIADQFVAALAGRARAGVKVHVIVDDHGGRKSRRYHHKLREAGVELERYQPVRLRSLHRDHGRTHRKLLVVDGKVGFIGSTEIADQWAGDAESPRHWRDCHYQIEGPSVMQLQGAFADNWLQTHHVTLLGPEYFPPLTSVGDVDAAVLCSSSRGGRDTVPGIYQLAIASARQSLRIENPYFVPDATIVEELVAATGRGVLVQLIVPGRHIDPSPVRRASRQRWRRLLEAGVEIHEYQPTMLHSKLLIVDGFFVAVGSANFDSHSWPLNDEANLNVLHAGFAAEQTELFVSDLANSVRVTLEDLLTRGQRTADRNRRPGS